VLGWRTRRLSATGATIALLLLLLSSCTSEDPSGDAAPVGSDPVESGETRGQDEVAAVGEPQTKLERARVEAQLRFARCMRRQGLDFPDPRPQPDGSFLHEPPENPAARAAYDRAGAICVKHFDAIRGVEMTPAERRELAKAIDRDREFARCMRAKGYGWPDPIPAEGGFRDDDLAAAGIDADDPQVVRDERDCMRRVGQPVPPDGSAR
jgi:hypothetical protein